MANMMRQLISDKRAVLLVLVPRLVLFARTRKQWLASERRVLLPRLKPTLICSTQYSQFSSVSGLKRDSGGGVDGEGVVIDIVSRFSQETDRRVGKEDLDHETGL